VQAEGIVVRCEAGSAHVKVRRSGGCGRCHEVGGCGGVSADDASCQEYLVGNALGANLGDRVLIEVPEGVALRAASLAYLLPLAGVLLGAFIAFLAWHSDLASALGALFGLTASYLWIRSRAVLADSRPRIAGILQA
jgi:sigma-E factor negative regulatory protein RseC